MVEEPIQALERNFTVYLLEHIEESRDAFIVGGMQPERPFVCGQQRHDTSLSSPSRDALRSGRGSRKSSKSAAEKHEHFAGAVAAEEIIALARPRHLDPAGKIFLFLLWLLGEEIVGDAQGSSRLCLCSSSMMA
jgi:hypothetical protein